MLSSPSRTATVITLVTGVGAVLVSSFNAYATDSPPPQVIPVVALPSAPTIDGELTEWDAAAWQTVPITPALKDDKKNRVGEATVALQMATYNDTIYSAVRWADPKPDTSYKPWRWADTSYRRGKEADDMFALRFEMGGDYDSCMLTHKEYEIDVWLWSAGRSNDSGYAEDMHHRISSKMIENAAEYKHNGATVYIKKQRDAGVPIYHNVRINKRKFSQEKLDSIIAEPAPAGSVADVHAKGVWRDGFWQLEMSRSLDSGHSDDAMLKGITEIRGAIAVFDRNDSNHKSNSGTLLFRF